MEAPSRTIRRVLVAAWGEPARPLVHGVEAAGFEAVALVDEPSAEHLHVEEAAWAAPLIGIRPSPLPRAVTDVEARRLVEAAMDAGADAILPAPGRYASSAALAHQAVLCGLAWCGARGDTLERIAEAPADVPEAARAARHVVVLLGDGEGGALPLGVQRRHRAAHDRRTDGPTSDHPAAEGWTELGPGVPAPLLDIARRHVRALRPWGMVGVHLDVTTGGAWLREVEPGLVGGWRLHERGLGVSLPGALLQLAGGEALGWQEADLGIRSVHLQAAIVATAAGTLEALELGDASVSTLPDGSEIDPAVDPILARVFVSGADRRAAHRALVEALHAVNVVGVPTNLVALRAAVGRQEPA